MEVSSVVTIGILCLFVGWAASTLHTLGRLGYIPLYSSLMAKIFDRGKTESTQEMNTLKETEEVLGSIREAIVAQLIDNEPLLFDAIAKQRIILANQERAPVAIFLSVDTFKGLLRNTLKTTDTEQIDSVSEALQRLNMPVGHLSTLPIYVSERLTKAPIFVAGGINWSLGG